jgi:DNA-binding HxlR family transcriptional regulator
MNDILCKAKNVIQNISHGETNIPLCIEDIVKQLPDIPETDISKALYDLEKEGFIRRINEISRFGIKTINMFTLA